MANYSYGIVTGEIFKLSSRGIHLTFDFTITSFRSML